MLYDGMVGKTCDSRDGGWMQGAYCRESREGNKDQVRVAFFVCCCSLMFDLRIGKESLEAEQRLIRKIPDTKLFRLK